MSALPFKADKAQTCWHVRFVPTPAVSNRSKADNLFDHLVGAGEERRWHFKAENPSCLQIDAQLKLCRLHDRQLCWVRALEDAARIDTDLIVSLGPAGAVAYQSASLDVFGARIGGRNPIARCEKHQLDPTRGKQWAAAYEQGIRPIMCERGKGGFDLAVVARLENACLQPHCAGCRFNFFQIPSSNLRIARVNQYCQSLDARHELAQRPNRFAPSSRMKKFAPVRFPPGLPRLATSPSRTGSPPTVKRIGIFDVAALAANADEGPPVAAMTATRRRTRSAASSGKRLTSFSAQRYSKATFSPST